MIAVKTKELMHTNRAVLSFPGTLETIKTQSLLLLLQNLEKKHFGGEGDLHFDASLNAPKRTFLSQTSLIL